MTRVLFGAAAVMLLTGLAPVTAKVPTAAPTMTAAGGSQQGHTLSSTTGSRGRDEKTCIVNSAVRVKSYPDPVGHDGSALTWRIPDRRKPAKVTATVDTDLPANDAGNRARRLPVSLAPVTTRGKVVAWTATTEAVGYGDLHLTLFVGWGGGCGGDSATYTFRALSLPVLVP